MKTSSVNAYLIAIISAILVFLAYPGGNVGWLAWFAWVPMIHLALSGRGLTDYLRIVWVFELLRWTLTVIWLRHVSWLAVPAIALPLSLYGLIWYGLLWKCRRWMEGHNAWMAWLASIVLAVTWGVMEWLRSFPLGIPGASVAVTQWKYPWMLELCKWIGAYGLSAWIIWLNLGLARWWQLRSCRMRIGQALIPLVVLSGWVGFSYFDDRQEEQLSTMSLDIAAVQPYQPAYRMWTRERMISSVETVFDLSLGVDPSEYELMLWPEGTLPWSIHEGSSMDEEVRRLVRDGLRNPLLMGNQGNRDGKLHNSVFFYDQDGNRKTDAYAKNILVPFGEYIPLRRWLSPLETVVPIPEDFVPGTGPVLFRLEKNYKQVNISSLVCYEDCFSQLAVRGVRAGADVFFVATYDVWYGEEWGAYLHAAHSVLRAAEVNRPFLRCGSAGWSGYIDADGRIRHTMRDPDSGSIYFRGADVFNIQIPTSAPMTVYSRLYEWITYGGLFFSLSGMMLFVLLERTTRFQGS